MRTYSDLPPGCTPQMIEDAQHGTYVADDGTEHCEDCFSPSHDDYRGFATPDMCVDEDCECHSPIIHHKNGMVEFLDSISVGGLIKELQQLPQGYRVCVQGCDGIGVYDITQLVPDERGFIEVYTFNSNSCQRALGRAEDAADLAEGR